MTGEQSRTFALLGHPVAHSVSPPIHAAAYRALGLSGYRYVTVDCPDEGSVQVQMEALRRGAIRGANVTVPWKRVALHLAGAAEPLAERADAANVLVVEERAGSRVIVAHNTDIAALGDELGERSGRQVRLACVIGSGGAARAAVIACQSLGAERIVVVARRWRASLDPVRWSGAEKLRALDAETVPWPDSDRNDSWARSVRAADVVVQATSAGMLGADSGEGVRDIVPWAELATDAFAYDVVYNPPVTPFLDAARRHGVACRGGLGMLVGQAARAFELWLGVEPPRVAMRRAAEKALFGEAR